MPKSAGGSFFAFDTYMEISYSHALPASREKEITSALGAKISELENIFSVTAADSETHQFNKSGSLLNPSPEFTALTNKSLEVSRLTDGAFDITAYPYVEAWGFTKDEYRIPEGNELSSLSKLVGYENVKAMDGGFLVPSGMKIDFGGIAKGYLGDVLKEMLTSNGIESGLLNLGGNVCAIGAKADGSPWRIGIKNPADPSKTLGYVEVIDKSVVTSGGYERYFVGPDGTKYCHIIDPFTGCPVNNSIESVTIIGSDGAMCDALSTALYVMGADKALTFIEACDGFEAIIILSDGEIFSSEGITFFSI